MMNVPKEELSNVTISAPSREKVKPAENYSETEDKTIIKKRLRKIIIIISVSIISLIIISVLLYFFITYFSKKKENDKDKFGEDKNIMNPINDSNEPEHYESVAQIKK